MQKNRRKKKCRYAGHLRYELVMLKQVQHDLTCYTSGFHITFANTVSLSIFA